MAARKSVDATTSIRDAEGVADNFSPDDTAPAPSNGAHEVAPTGENGFASTRKAVRRRRTASNGNGNGNGSGDTYTTRDLEPLLDAMTALRDGDFSVRLPVPRDGSILAELHESVNQSASLHERLVRETSRVAGAVGREGRMTERAALDSFQGDWRAIPEAVNLLVENLTLPTTEVARVLAAVAAGDLSQQMALEIDGTPVQGEFIRIRTTVNTLVGQLSAFAAEVTRVAREVGTEGKLGGQAHVPGVAGTWKDLTDNVNFMAGNLTSQVRNIALVTTAVANGDLSKKITVDARGEILELKDTVNTMVDQLNSFAAEVTRVAREVGTEGILGGQAQVRDVAGTWKDLTDNVNVLAGNLTVQVRGIAKVVTSVANGDLKQKLVVDARGEVAALADTINGMTDTLSTFAAQVTSVAREVGTEGKLGGQAHVPGVAGTWKDLTDNVNVLAGNLTNQVRNIALVTTAVANGDLSQKITVDASGEILELKNTINIMVDQLGTFAGEVTRVAREVGMEGKLGGQAEVRGVSGTWKDLTDNVNVLAGNLTDQVRNIALVTTAVANGDLSKKITVNARGEILELKDTINIMVDQLNSFAAEVTRVAREVGTEGKLGGQAEVRGVSGTWKDLTDNVNFMAGNLTNQVRNIALVTTAVANGDLSKKITVDARGEILELKDTINTMVDQLNSFAAEVTRMAREVGTEGVLGGQAEVQGIAGTWKDLTDNVNVLAGNLTVQLRDVSKVATAIANGDLTQKITVDVRGEILQIKAVINQMVDQLGSFAAEVTRVAREVGTEGILGGQAQVRDVAGTWKDLTDNVNFMADSLTVQVRAISDVATAVAEGDLTRSITVEAQGEVSALKVNLNRMIGNLKTTTQLNDEQDWLKTNLARFSRLMQGQKNLEEVASLIMSELTPLVSAHHGAFYIDDHSDNSRVLRLIASYAFQERKSVSSRFARGEGLVGQCALEKKSILLTHVPSDYIQINSGLGQATPLNIIVLPVLFEGEVMAVVELASFQPFSQIHTTFLDQLMETVGVVLNMIAASQRTEQLLEQSQLLTQELQNQSQELQSQQGKLRESNIELEDKAALLAEQNIKVEQKNHEVELARAALEDKAEQLATSSRYKSEFLANMSHELRTPLNSMLILAKLLSDNAEKNLTDKQTEFAQTIYNAGGDLLSLINEILDLSKVEAGKMEIEISDVRPADLKDYVERNFYEVAQSKNLGFSVEIESDAPDAVRTDAGRLQQVLKNLLSNAIKFTERGGVNLTIRRPARGEFPEMESLASTRGDSLIAFSVRDTGIGIAPEKQQLIFEAFQQADGTTSRQYGGTGLGLSISREITRILGGRIFIHSVPGQGSEFTILLPQNYHEEYKPSGLATAQIAAPSAAAMRDASTRRFSASAAPASISTTASTRTEMPAFKAPEFTAKNGAQSDARISFAVAGALGETVEDDRDNIQEGDRILLVIEDDLNFSRIMVDMAREKGFKVLAALRGDIGIAMAKKYLPDAITLDLQLPLIDGWEVLDHLKRTAETRHIPVQVISVMDRERGSTVGAISYIEKPVSRDALEGALMHMSDFLERSVRRVLVVEDDETQRDGIRRIVGNAEVEIVEASSGESALQHLETIEFDCMILDLGLPDMAGFELLKQVRRQSKLRDLPVIIHTSRDLTKDEETQLKKYAERIVVKDARAPERLLDETAMFLHRVVAKMPDAERTIIETNQRARDGESDASTRETISGETSEDASREYSQAPNETPLSPEELVGRKILIVDDDVRNVFALTSALENYGLQVDYAESGTDSLTFLRENRDIDLVLMDVMMPGMDGNEATTEIRKIPEYAQVPIIVVTANAMQGDRERSLQAGASDYLTKPVDLERMLSTLGRWLKKSGSD